MDQMACAANSALFGIAIVWKPIQNCRATGSAVFDQLALVAQAFLAGDLAAEALVCFSIKARAVSSNFRPS